MKTKEDKPLISTTILNWNRADLLRRTIQSYLETISVPYEMFIIDNASTDGSRDVIENFCSKTPNVRGVYLSGNCGGEAINIGLKHSRGRFLHISENDIEYLPGWSEKTIALFESFPSLGQLSLFGPVPEDEEVWELKPSVLRHSRGHIVYETPCNVGTTSMLRREVWDCGVRINNIQKTGDFLFPDDAQLSEDIKRAGFMVAWADHYMVKNLGHFASEFKGREEYYKKNYSSKPWLGESGWRIRIKEWEGRPRPVRNSFLFPEERISGEKSQPSNECPNPQHWSMIDGWTAEVETLEFLYTLVRLIKPFFAIETGTWHGYAAESIGRALLCNGEGMLVTLEKDPESYQVASERIRRKKLDEYVRVLNQSSLTYNADNPIDFLLLDSDLNIRFDEFKHFLANLKPGAIVVFHDTSRSHNTVREGVKELIDSGLLTGFFMTTPRGIAVCQYTGTQSFKNGVASVSEEIASVNTKVRTPLMVIVLGMHRCGTSLITSILSKAGFYVGEDRDLLKGDKWNRNGYFELRQIVELNDNILDMCNGTWDAPPDEEDIFRVNIDSEIGSLLKVYSSHDKSIIKDPRMCLTFPVWQRMLGDNVRIININRDAAAVAASLMKRDGFPIQKGLALWHIYTERALKSVKDYPVFSIQYEDLFTSKRSEILKGLAGFLEVESNLEKMAVQVIDPGLNHFKRGTDYNEHLLYDSVQRFINNGMYEEAIKALENLLYSYPDHALAHNDLGVLYYHRGEKDKAVSHIKKSLELNGDNLHARENLASIYLESDLLQEERKIDESILSQNPKQKTGDYQALLDDNTIDYSGKDKFNVGYIVCDPPEFACPTIRVLSPLGKLKDKIALEWPVMQREENSFIRKDKLYKTDILLVQRLAFFSESISKLKSPWQKVIYEIDDFLLDVPASNPYKTVIEGFRNRIIDAISKADAVTVSTNALKERLSAYNKNIHVLPNYIDLDIWGGKVRNPVVKKDKVIIAFIGTPTHQEDLSMITPAIKKVIREYGEKVVFRFFGCITKELLQLKGVEFVSDLIPDYRAFARYMKSLNIDIALAPLVNNSFNECKSNIKFLEYSICSIPGIYSRITPYASSITDGKTGVLCDDDQGSWYKAMVKLIENEELRRQIAESAYIEVMEKYTLEANAYRWYDFYKSLIEETTHRISIVTTKKGNPSLRVSCDDGSVKTLHSLYDPEAEAMTIVDAFRFDGRGMLVVLGLGFGYHLKELVQRFPEAEILVIETMPEIYELAKQYGMLSGLEGRINFVVGLSAEEAIREITSQQMKLGMVSLSVFSLSSAVSTFQDYYSPILAALRNTTNVKLWDRLRYPKFREDIYSVALIDFGYFLTREIEAALVSLGHRVVKVPVSREEGGEVIVSRLIKRIYEFKPDFILTINHLGLDEDGVLTSFLESIEMPLASWYVDSPNLIVRAFDRNVSPYVSLFLWDRGYIKDLEAVGFESVTYLPLATDETVFKPIKNRKKPGRYQCDVSFVGNSMVVPALESLEKIPGGLHHLVEKTALLLSSTRMPFDAVLATLEKEELILLDSLPAQERLDFEAAILWRATLLYRLSCIEVLKDFHPRIHGDEAWKKLLNNDYTFGPTLNYYNELPAFYNACKINFNATSLQMSGAVNQRVFDVPACGAFLLTDHQEAIEELFDIGKEVVTYGNRDEIPELTGFYLRNPKEREIIIRKGRERILKEHTYRHRLSSIIQNMKTRYVC